MTRDGRGREPEDIATLVLESAHGRTAATARLLTLAEEDLDHLLAVAAQTVTTAGLSHRTGFTGPPGAGKSTLVSALTGVLRRGGARVGALAVDPSSVKTGGALLGDRIRMREHTLDEGVFIRSLASRGALGGTAFVVPVAIQVLAAAGYEHILIETVGVGQSEIDIKGLCDTSVVVVNPDQGDTVQALKSGILEIGDVYVINKADREGADLTRRHLREAVMNMGTGTGEWRPRILQTQATQGVGVESLAEAIADHRAWLTGLSDAEAAQRRQEQLQASFEQALVVMTTARYRRLLETRLLDRLDSVRSGHVDPWSAALATVDEHFPE